MAKKHEIKFWNVQRPKGIVLYATCKGWKKARFFDPYLSRWEKSMGLDDVTSLPNSTQVFDVPNEIKSLIK